MRRFEAVVIASAVAVGSLLLILAPALARDPDGRYAGSWGEAVYLIVTHFPSSELSATSHRIPSLSQRSIHPSMSFTE